MNSFTGLFLTASACRAQPDRPSGGVQICTEEYLSALARAGGKLTVEEFTPSRDLLTRIKRKLFRKPYTGLIPAEFVSRLLARIRTEKPQYIFLNLVDLAPVARAIKNEFGGSVQVVLLSHGLGCADVLHELRVSSMDAPELVASKTQLAWLAGHITAEADQRKYIDHVFCLSDFDVGLERWVGAKRISWLPRIVNSNPLDWQPVDGRVGFVGTLNHAPTIEGLELFLRASAKSNSALEIRLIGGPDHKGHEIASRYPNVRYLSRMDDAALKVEASTWSCAIHPLFCYSRGCSTKLAILLGWEIPIVTTPAGCRGYTWEAGSIPQAESPEDFARLVECSICEPARTRIRSQVVMAKSSSPSIDEVANMIRFGLALQRDAPPLHSRS
jgi:hypothetical protein